MGWIFGLNRQRALKVILPHRLLRHRQRLLCDGVRLTRAELQRVQQHSLALIKSAEERVAGFLLEMAGRNSAGSAVELPMSRQDIADYLGLTIETVSRTFTQLVQSGTIALETTRRIQLRNRPALNRLNA